VFVTPSMVIARVSPFAMYDANVHPDGVPRFRPFEPAERADYVGGKRAIDFAGKQRVKRSSHFLFQQIETSLCPRHCSVIRLADNIAAGFTRLSAFALTSLRLVVIIITLIIVARSSLASVQRTRRRCRRRAAPDRSLPPVLPLVRHAV